MLRKLQLIKKTLLQKSIFQKNTSSTFGDCVLAFALNRKYDPTPYYLVLTLGPEILQTASLELPQLEWVGHHFCFFFVNAFQEQPHKGQDKL